MLPPPPISTLFPYTTLFRSAYATAPALVLVGVLMCGAVARVRWDDFSESFPAFLTLDRKSTRLNSSHVEISYAVFCLKKKNRPPHNLVTHARYSASLLKPSE